MYATILHAALAFGVAHTHNIDRFYDQIEHIKRTPEDLKTIFVGDSTLGNAILFDGPDWANLALTSAYGYSGSYNMMRNAVLMRPSIKNVVVVQSVKIPVSPVNWIAYYNTLPPYDQSLLTRTKGLFWKTLFFLEPGVQRGILFQIAVKAFANEGHFIKKPIQPRQIVFLDKITEFCRSHSLNCLYMFGPFRQSICDLVPEYIEKVVLLLRAHGQRVLDEILPCVPDEEMDPTSDEHILHDLRPEYTRKYLSYVQSYLRT